MLASTSRKRGAESPNSIYSNKSRSRPSVEARIDPTYGQRSALPGLNDEENLFGSDEEHDGCESKHDYMKALSYLSSVRQEALGIPNLLVASKPPSTIINHPSQTENFMSTSSRYEDGAYLSVSNEIYESDMESEASENDYFDECFKSLLDKYEKLKTRLQQKPPSHIISKLKPHQRTQVGPLNASLSKWWIWHMKNLDPNPIQLASMDKATVLRLLSLLSQGTALKTGLKVSSCLSRWTWSLLARLPDRGDLASEEIGIMRGLAKKAILLGNNLRENHDWGEMIQDDDELYETHSEDHDDYRMRSDDENQVSNTVTEEVGINEPSKSPCSTLDFQSKTLPSETDLKHILTHCKNSDRECSDQVNTYESQEDKTKDNFDVPPKSTEMSGAPDDLLAIKERLLERLCDENNQEPVNFEPEIPQESAPNDEIFLSPQRWNAQATIDMILTIVGETYGQRDLLESRGYWDCYV